MKILTKDLIGPPLDWATCHALGNPNGFCGQMLQRPISYVFRPSTSGSEVIDIMEREKIDAIWWHSSQEWCATTNEHLRYDERGEFVEGSNFASSGPTVRIAVCRCYVAAKLGDEVEVPEELA